MLKRYILFCPLGKNTYVTLGVTNDIEVVSIVGGYGGGSMECGGVMIGVFGINLVYIF